MACAEDRRPDTWDDTQMKPSLKQLCAAWHDESGAVTVDWVVLSATTLTLGLSSVGLVQTGVVDLGSEINVSMTAAGVAGAAAYSFYRLTEAQQQDMLAVYMSRTPEQLVANSQSMSDSFLATLESGNLDEAARWMDRRQLNQTALEANGLTAAEGSMTVAQMETLYLEAGGT
ncbi:hypothetical protein J1C52_00475 [Roseibaca sp. Y0-43]|nr:hypothetical protein [Roseibaca sp. Y0-43]